MSVVANLLQDHLLTQSLVRVPLGPLTVTTLFSAMVISITGGDGNDSYQFSTLFKYLTIRTQDAAADLLSLQRVVFGSYRKPPSAMIPTAASCAQPVAKSVWLEHANWWALHCCLAQSS